MGHWDPLPGQQVCGRPWHCPQSAPLPWDTLAQHIKTLPMDLQWHRTTVWPHILGMCFLDLKLALATLLYLFVWKEAKEIITRRTASLCCVACAAFRSGIPPWDGSHTPIPSANLPFRMKQIIEKVIWFYFTHCLTPKQSFFLPLCISDAALSVLIKNTRAHVFVPTCTYGRTWVQVLEPHAHASAAKVVLSFYLAGYDKDKLWASFSLYRIYSSDE